MVFAFLCATNKTNALTFGRTFDFHKNLARRNKEGFDKLDKPRKRILQRMNPKRIKTKFLNLHRREISAQKRGHESFKIFNFFIREIVAEVEVQKMERSYQGRLKL